MPNPNITLTTLRKNRHWETISKLEVDQILALTKLYGRNLTMNALRHSQTSALSEITRLLIQMGGFPPQLPDCLKTIMMDETQANHRYSPQQMEISRRLWKATRIVSDYELRSDLYRWCRNQSERDIVRRNIVGLSEAQNRELFPVIKKFGPPLISEILIQWQPFIKYDEETSILKFKEWRDEVISLEGSCRREVDGTKLNITFETCPHRLNRYHWAKTGFECHEYGYGGYGRLAFKFNIDLIIFVMSTIRGDEMNPDDVQKKCRMISNPNRLNENEDEYETEEERMDREQDEEFRRCGMVPTKSERYQGNDFPLTLQRGNYDDYPDTQEEDENSQNF